MKQLFRSMLCLILILIFTVVSTYCALKAYNLFFTIGFGASAICLSILLVVLHFKKTRELTDAYQQRASDRHYAHELRLQEAKRAHAEAIRQRVLREESLLAHHNRVASGLASLAESVFKTCDQNNPHTHELRKEIVSLLFSLLEDGAQVADVTPRISSAALLDVVEERILRDKLSVTKGPSWHREIVQHALKGHQAAPSDFAS